MSTKLSYQKLQPLQTPQLSTKATNQQRFWKKYINQQLLTSSSITNCISSNNNDKNIMLFGHGRTLSILDTTTKQIIRKIQNYTYPITAITIRKDGLVMATGDQQGRIEVKDTKQKFNLRTFDNHKKRINCLDYYAQDLYSGGQDMIIRLYDVASGIVIHSYQHAHNDYIKCIKGLENNHVLSGGYDGYVKLYDFRVHEKAQLQFNHGNQVQGLDLFPSNINFVVCGDKKITSWDIRQSSKPIFQNISSKKLLTGIKVLSHGHGSRIISSSYDCYLKVYKSDTFQCTYQQKMQSPILCFDVSKNNQFLGIGLENKKIIMKCRANTKNQDDQQAQDEKQIQEQLGLWLKNNQEKKFAYNDKYFYRGIYAKPQNFDIKFQRNQNKKVSQYDKFLKKFQYKKALFTSLNKKNMTIFLALIDEYQQRGCLQRVLKSLTQPQLQQLLKFLSQLIHDIRYNQVASMLISKLINIHNDIDSLEWNNVKNQINQEIQTIQSLGIVNGMLDLIQKNCNVN